MNQNYYMFVSYDSFEAFLIHAFSGTSTPKETILSSTEAVLRAMTLSNLPSSDVKNDSWVGENWFLVVAELAQVIDDSVTYVRVTLEAMDRLGDKRQINI